MTQWMRAQWKISAIQWQNNKKLPIATAYNNQTPPLTASFWSQQHPFQVSELPIATQPDWSQQHPFQVSKLPITRTTWLQQRSNGRLHLEEFGNGRRIDRELAAVSGSQRQSRMAKNRSCERYQHYPRSLSSGWKRTSDRKGTSELVKGTSKHVGKELPELVKIQMAVAASRRSGRYQGYCNNI
jgi:hypothetical protein